MNKIKNLLKASPILMVVAGILVAGVASAALLVYYGKITGSTTVEQSVILDGGASVKEVSENPSGSAGDVILGDIHRLENNAGVDAIVSLDSTLCPWGQDCAGLTVLPIFHLEPVVGTTNDDEDAVHFIIAETNWVDFTGVSFWYMAEWDNTGGKVPHVNIMLRNPGNPANFCLLSASPAAAEVESITEGGWTDWKKVTYQPEDFGVVVGSCSGATRFDSITIESGNPGAVNGDSDLQRVWIRTPVVNEGEIATGWFRVPEKNYGSVPARTVWFRMAYDFAINTAASTYGVVTVVTPRGEYTKGGVYTP